MPCHVPATSASSRRRSFLPRSNAPRVVAQLDLQRPGERAAHDLVRRFASGRHPLWRILGIRRGDKCLYIGVEWRRGHDESRFSVVELSMTEIGLRWSSYATEQHTRQALNSAERTA
jgi:hypothetical protein